MSVEDCLKEYETLGDVVFSHPRWGHIRAPPWIPREKYSHKKLKQVVKHVVDENVPKIGTFPGGKTFRFDENRCRVLVILHNPGIIDGLLIDLVGSSSHIKSNLGRIALLAHISFAHIHTCRREQPQMIGKEHGILDLHMTYPYGRSHAQRQQRPRISKK